jgi:hypothetical protein
MNETEDISSPNIKISQYQINFEKFNQTYFHLRSSCAYWQYSEHPPAQWRYNEFIHPQINHGFFLFKDFPSLCNRNVLSPTRLIMFLKIIVVGKTGVTNTSFLWEIGVSGKHVKVKLSLLQAVEAHKVARGQGSHIT